MRDLRRMSQAELGSAVQLTRAAISSIELGKQAITLELFYKISLALKTDPVEMLTRIISSEKFESVMEVEVEDQLIRSIIVKTLQKD